MIIPRLKVSAILRRENVRQKARYLYNKKYYSP